MRKVKLETALRKAFVRRPDEAYTFDEVLHQFETWKSEARRYKRGEVCARAGSPAGTVAVVVSGVLHVRVKSKIGEDVLMYAVRPGEYSGLSQVFVPEKKHPYDIVAGAETEVIVFQAEDVRKWRTDPKSLPLFDYLANRLVETLYEAQAKGMIVGAFKIEERLRRYLTFRMQREHSRTIAVAGLEDDLARYLCVNKCSMSRVISKLRREGKIGYHRNVFTILDWDSKGN